MLIEHLPESLHQTLKDYNSERLEKIMVLMSVRIHFFHDMAKHQYFFTDPQYESAIALKFLAKLKRSKAEKLQLLSDLNNMLSRLEDFHSAGISMACSEYLKNQKELHGEQIKSDDVYSMIRFAVSGNPVGAPVGDICEIIGQKDVARRLLLARDFIGSIKEED